MWRRERVAASGVGKIAARRARRAMVNRESLVRGSVRWALIRVAESSTTRDLK